MHLLSECLHSMSMHRALLLSRVRYATVHARLPRPANLEVRHGSKTLFQSVRPSFCCQATQEEGIDKDFQIKSITKGWMLQISQNPVG